MRFCVLGSGNYLLWSWFSFSRPGVTSVNTLQNCAVSKFFLLVKLFFKWLLLQFEMKTVTLTSTIIIVPSRDSPSLLPSDIQCLAGLEFWLYYFAEVTKEKGLCIVLCCFLWAHFILEYCTAGFWFQVSNWSTILIRITYLELHFSELHGE